MQIFDTYSEAIQEFVPAHRPVRLYVCGITPYDATHMGHAFTYVFFDVLVRYLEFLGYPVRYVQNVTDIDDDILHRAAELGEPWYELAREQTERYVEDMVALNVRPPNVFPRASREIPRMVEIIEILLRNGFAYRASGNVYFPVQADPDYGALSHLAPDEMLAIASERGNDPNDPYKLNPLDFVLWQERKPGEPWWESPFSRGRPGWHIECSAMSLKYLGETLDIHGGGTDLVFPHHESEIAQSEHATGRRPFARYWVHTGMVHYRGEKMSKSLGNLVMVREVLAAHSADALRVYLLSHHYRHRWSYDARGLTAAEALAQHLVLALQASSNPGSPIALDPASWRGLFLEAMDDDMNTPAALTSLSGLAGEIVASGSQGQDVLQAQLVLREMMNVLGLPSALADGQAKAALGAAWRCVHEPSDCPHAYNTRSGARRWSAFN